MCFMMAIISLAADIIGLAKEIQAAVEEEVAQLHDAFLLVEADLADSGVAATVPGMRAFASSCVASL
jgi:hypothetical protein